MQTTAPMSVILPAPSVTSTAPRPSIRQAIPSRIAIPDIGYQANVGQMTTKANGDVKPPTLQDAYLITNVGTMPGTDAANTAYMACHAWSKGDAPCNLVPQVVPGQHVLVTTPNGTLDYVVQATKLFYKHGELQNPPAKSFNAEGCPKPTDKVVYTDSCEVWRAMPGRLVLVTCYELNGVATQNFVVFAQLVTE